MTTAKTPAAFLAQAIPWVVLFVLWAILALVCLLTLVFPLRILAWAIKGVSNGVELVLAALLTVLFISRPVPPKGTPKDPTATAPVTGGAA